MSPLSPVVEYHGLARRDRQPPDFWMRPPLNGDTLGGRELRVSTWEPITEPVSWKREPLVAFRQSRALLETTLGPPQVSGVDSNGLGLYDLWALRFQCGLEVLLLAFHDSKFVSVPRDCENWIDLQSSDTDLAHIAAHLPFDLRELSPWLPNRRAARPPAWFVMRQDDNGNVFELARCTSRCEAQLKVDALESLGHKQTYWVDDRTREVG